MLAGPAGIQPKFIGFRNYGELGSDRYFWTALLHTAEFMLMAVPLITAAGLGLAVALNRPMRSFGVMRGIIFLSGAFSVSVLTLIWLMVLNPSRGLVGQAMHVLGLPSVDVLADRRLVMPALVLITMWWSAGFPMALFLAALQQIPRELYEAAQLDGAGRWRTFRHITMPGIQRTFWLVVMIEVILQIQVFGQVILLTKGGPAHSTRVLVQYLYEKGFRDWQVGYASAVGMVLFSIMVVASLAQRALTTREGAR
ncbi:MAG: carbohydrate ABC transporter permease [Nitrospira sp.]